SHHLTFVVAGSASDNDPAPVGQRVDARLERRMGPEVERIDRLHVIVPVEQSTWAGAATTSCLHDRATSGWPHLGIEIERRQILRDMQCRSPTLLFVCRIG